jgi:acetyl coenzyme A synthetase (ADP forming)-like protein
MVVNSKHNSETDIDYFFNPKGIAVIGASAKEGKVGFSVINNIKNSGYKGNLFPINPSSPEILGYKTYKSILDVKEEIDIAVIVIPAKYVIDVVEECAKKGIKGLIVISAGFKEIGGEGVTRELELIKICKENKIRILGPNCLGIITLNYNASFAADQPKKGNIAIISQSGAMLTGMLDYSMGRTFGFSCCISLGNKADLTLVDFLKYLVDDENTKVILAYIENIVDGDRFLKIVPYIARKKPIVILKSGISEQGAKAASSHTGALAGSDRAYDLSFEKTGVIRAKTIEDLFDYGEIFAFQPIPKKNSFVIISNAGGPGIVAADAFSREGLKFTKFSEVVLHELRKNLPTEASIFNPVDIVGDAPPERYKFTLETIFGLNSNSYSTVGRNQTMGAVISNNSLPSGCCVILAPQALTKPTNVAELILQISKKIPNVSIVCSFIGEKNVAEGRNLLNNNHIPCYYFPDRAAQTLKILVKYSENKNRIPLDELNIEHFTVDKNRINEIFEEVRRDNRSVLLSYETIEIFQIFGIPAPKSKLARSPIQAFELSKKVGFPSVLKVVSPQILHKTDVGGVLLNIHNQTQAREAYTQIMTNVKKFGPKNTKIYGIEIQEMINYKRQTKINELILGMSRDPTFGPMIMVGSGGIYANFIKDIAFALTYKFSREEAFKLLSQTKIFALLQGVRGEPPSDIDSVIDILLKLSQLVNDFPEILELDINPLLSFVKGCSAVDIKITIKS